MSDNFIHNLASRDLKSVRILLNMPKADPNSDIETLMIREEEKHLLNGTTVRAVLSFYNWLMKIEHQVVECIKPDPHQVPIKSHSYIRH